jgi:hypothetical protein
VSGIWHHAQRPWPSQSPASALWSLNPLMAPSHPPVLTWHRHRPEQRLPVASSTAQQHRESRRAGLASHTPDGDGSIRWSLTTPATGMRAHMRWPAAREFSSSVDGDGDGAARGGGCTRTYASLLACVRTYQQRARVDRHWSSWSSLPAVGSERSQ